MTYQGNTITDVEAVMNRKQPVRDLR